MFISFFAVLQVHNMSSSAVYILDVKGKVRLFLPILNILNSFSAEPVVLYIWVCCVWVVSVMPPGVFSVFFASEFYEYLYIILKFVAWQVSGSGQSLQLHSWHSAYSSSH